MPLLPPLLQVLVPGLEERARFLPHLERLGQLTPGYLDAPATALAPLGPVDHVGRRTYPDVTLVFCALSKWVPRWLLGALWTSGFRVEPFKLWTSGLLGFDPSGCGRQG